MVLVTTETEHIKIVYPGLGKKIRHYRNQKRYSQEKLAEFLGISWMTIHRWEKDLRGIKLSLLEELSSILEVNLDYMMTYSREEVVA